MAQHFFSLAFLLVRVSYTLFGY